MVRISDILKQGGEVPEPPSSDKERKERKVIPIPSPEQYSPGLEFSKAMAQEKPEAEKELQVAKAVRETQFDPEESRNIYKRALEIIKDILDKTKSDTPLDLREAYEITKIIVDRIVLGDKELILSIDNSSTDNYLYAHEVNVCILSIDVGLGFGYNKSKLNELGLGALLHDVGMMKVIDLASQPRKLSEDEFKKVKQHPIYSTDILSKVKDIQQGVLYISAQVHERHNGKGYPKGLKGSQIHEYAKIVAVVDVYEALTHPRPHRKAMSPCDSIKELLGANFSGFFDTLILKLLINRIGIYPPGSWVELNSGEIAKVISPNEESPLRPKVNIIFGPDKQRLAQIKSLDLHLHSNLYIKRNIIPQDLNLKLE